MNKRRLWVVYISVNIGVLGWALVAEVVGLPIRRTVSVALFSAIGANALVWILARLYIRSSTAASRQPTLAARGITVRQRWFRWIGVGMCGVGLSSCVLSLWTGVGQPSFDSSLWVGVILLAQGLLLLMYSRGTNQ